MTIVANFQFIKVLSLDLMHLYNFSDANATVVTEIQINIDLPAFATITTCKSTVKQQ